jgi:hypothetical protein
MQSQDKSCSDRMLDPTGQKRVSLGHAFFVPFEGHCFFEAGQGEPGCLECRPV